MRAGFSNPSGRFFFQERAELIKKRRNLDKQFLKLLENEQASEKIKKSYADFTVDNSTKDKVKLQVKKILDKILLND